MEAIRILAWPVFAAAGIMLFREPITGFFEAIGSRASKIGAFSVSLELSALPEARAWSGPALDDLRTEYPTVAMDSAGSLFVAIADTTLRSSPRTRLAQFSTFTLALRNQYRRFIALDAAEGEIARRGGQSTTGMLIYIRDVWAGEKSLKRLARSPSDQASTYDFSSSHSLDKHYHGAVSFQSSWCTRHG